MKQAKTVDPQAQTVGRHYSYQVIRALCQILPTLWCDTSRDEHRSDSMNLVTQSFASLRNSALFEICRNVRDATGEPLNAEHDAQGRLWRHFARRDNIAALASAYCQTITEAAGSIEVLRQAAKLEINEGNRRLLNIGFYSMKRQLSQLLEVGLLAELPVTSQIVAPDEVMLTKVAGVLIERRAVYNKASMDNRFEPWIRAGLAESRGCRLFDSVRAQERHRAEICVEGLVRYLARPNPRFRRAIFADPALGLYEVFEVAVQHRKSIKNTKPGSLKRQRRINASLISWITVVELLRTGFLNKVGAAA